jgi:FKBP-type peptidyl-prolyl cis-trans isomerase
MSTGIRIDHESLHSGSRRSRPAMLRRCGRAARLTGVNRHRIVSTLDAMQIQKRTLGWFQKQSAWQEMQARREKSAAYREKDEAQRTTLNNMLQTLTTDASVAAGDLAAKAALKRIETEAAEKKKETQRKVDDELTRETIWKNKEPKIEVKAGDVTIDLQGDTVTLSDGTRLDTKTGKPAGNYLTLADGSRIDLDTGRKVIDTTV